MNWMKEMDNLVETLEKDIPASPRRKENEKQEEKLRQEFADYFKALENALDDSKLEQIYLANAGKE